MRIIGGEYRGRRLLAPQTRATRPVTDRVKQSIFDILAPQIAGAMVYDCFAGTGSMGLECLSRGVDHVTFFESQRSAARILRKNIELLRVQNRSRIIMTDVFGWMADARNTATANLIFLDPPYRFLRDRSEDLRRLSANLIARHLAPGATVIFRHDSSDSLEFADLKRMDLRDYGSMVVEFLERVA